MFHDIPNKYLSHFKTYQDTINTRSCHGQETIHGHVGKHLSVSSVCFYNTYFLKRHQCLSKDDESINVNLIVAEIIAGITIGYKNDYLKLVDNI